MQGKTVLIVDDEKEIIRLLDDYLTREQFKVLSACDGEQALQLFESEPVDLAVLDIMLPKLDGQEVCRRMRSRSDIPILMLSAKEEDVDKIISLGLGADDYITKPFSPRELVARVKAHIRRYTTMLEKGSAIEESPVEKKAVIDGPKGSASSPNAQTVLRFGCLEIMPDSYEVKLMGRLVLFKTKEFELLHFLACHPNRVFRREELLVKVWGYQETSDPRTVTVHINRIREKLETEGRPQWVQTVWGVGYKFVSDLL